MDRPILRIDSIKVDKHFFSKRESQKASEKHEKAEFPAIDPRHE